MIYFIIVIIIIHWKWIAFILLSPFIKSISRKDSIWNLAFKTPRTLAVRLIWFIRRHVEWFIRYIDIHVGFIPSFRIRNIIYTKILMAKIAPTVVLHYGAEIRSHSNLNIQAGSIIGDKALLDARNGITIGKNVNFSSNVQIYTEQHDHRDPDFKCKGGPVLIEDRVWIGPSVIILPNVKIGEGSVVAAGAVVTKDVSPFTIVAGIPAKPIGDRTRDLNYSFNGERCRLY